MFTLFAAVFVASVVMFIVYPICVAVQMAREQYAMWSYITVIRRRDYQLLIVEYAAWLIAKGDTAGAKLMIGILRSLRRDAVVETVPEVQLHFACTDLMPRDGFTVVDYMIFSAVKEAGDEAKVRKLLAMKYRKAEWPSFCDISEAAVQTARRLLAAKDEVEQAVLGCVMFRIRPALASAA